MSDVLAGMTRKDAEALVRCLRGVSLTFSGTDPCGGRDALDTISALAALGAKVVGGEFVTPLESFGYAHDCDGIVQTYVADKRRNRVLVLEADHGAR